MTTPPRSIGHNRSLVTPHYAMMPPEGILVSILPGFERSIIRFQTSPEMGARFAQCLLEIAPDGGTTAPRDDGLEHFLFVVSGAVMVGANDDQQRLTAGGFAYLPTGTRYAIRNAGAEQANVVWVKRRYVALPDIPAPPVRFGHRDSVQKTAFPGQARWRQFLLGHADLAFDFEMNLMGFAPGTHFPAVETHIMEHGLVMLQGQGMQLLARDWHEVWAGDFIWMGPYVPQQFFCTGDGEAVYLLYKNVNRDVTL